jgi:hypothetical protein
MYGHSIAEIDEENLSVKKRQLQILFSVSKINFSRYLLLLSLLIVFGS